MFIVREEIKKNMETSLDLIAIISPTLAVVLLTLIVIIVIVMTITIGKRKAIRGTLDIREDSACVVGINSDTEPFKAMDSNLCK